MFFKSGSPKLVYAARCQFNSFLSGISLPLREFSKDAFLHGSLKLFIIEGKVNNEVFCIQKNVIECLLQVDTNKLEQLTHDCGHGAGYKLHKVYNKKLDAAN